MYTDYFGENIRLKVTVNCKTLSVRACYDLNGLSINKYVPTKCRMF